MTEIATSCHAKRLALWGHGSGSRTSFSSVANWRRRLWKPVPRATVTPARGAWGWPGGAYQASPTDAGAALAFFRDADQPNAILRVMATSTFGREWEQVEPGDLYSSREGSDVVGGGLFDSDRQLIGLVISRDEQKITALRLDVLLEWLRSGVNVQ